MTEQVPPADDLYNVRTMLKALKEREEVLRQLMLTDPSARTGNKYVVEIREVTADRTDLIELKACHPELVAEFTFPVTQKRVELRGITDDGEVVSLRRKPAKEIQP